MIYIEHSSSRTNFRSSITSSWKIRASIMKIAAVLFILSVCYIASKEQAAVPAGVHTYPSRSLRKEMERKTREEYEIKSKVLSQNAKVSGYRYLLTPYEDWLHECAEMDCGLISDPSCEDQRQECQLALEEIEEEEEDRLQSEIMTDFNTKNANLKAYKNNNIVAQGK